MSNYDIAYNTPNILHFPLPNFTGFIPNLYSGSGGRKTRRCKHKKIKRRKNKKTRKHK